MSWRRYPKATQRRQATGGIQARSNRGAIGETWWSQRFIAVLESFDMGSRLTRGRSYARSGQVMDLEVRPGEVTAQVQGSRRAPYQVSITVKSLSDSDWARAEAVMAEQALFMAKLLAGEMPQQIEDAFAGSELSLFPAKFGDLETDCSCPDWANPCKHLAATFYILAEKFDDDPFLIFAWRGRSKDALTKELRALRRSSSDAVAAPSGVASDSPNPPPLDELPLESFWLGETELPNLSFHPRAIDAPEHLLRHVGQPPGLPGARQVQVLRAVYRTIALEAERRALEGSCFWENS